MIRAHNILVAATALLSFSALADLGLAADVRVVKKVGIGDASYVVGTGAPVAISGSGNEAIPEHAVITTGAGTELYIETFSGAVATIRQNSSVALQELAVGSKRKVRLNLKSGEIVSTIDPTRKNETDYAIVTPTGVAAARGTVYAVRVIPSDDGKGRTSVGTLSGIVEIDRGPGVPPLRVPFGEMAVNSSEAQALAALALGDPTVADDIVSAVEVVATNVGSATSGVGTSPTATAELAAVTSAAISAVPSRAATIVTSAVHGAAVAGATTSGNPNTTATALAAITGAAVRAAAAANPQQIGVIAEAATAAVTSAGVTTSKNDNSVSAAVSAVTAAAVSAAPTQAAAAAQGAAKGVIETKVTEAVNAAKAANPNLSGEDLAKVANDVANGPGATAAISTIATTATGSLLASTGQGGNTAAANSAAASIAAAVNSGSNSGAGVASSLIPPTSTPLTGATVSVTVTQTQAGTVINSTSGNSDVHSTATQTVNGNSLSPIKTQTVAPTGTTQNTVTPVAEILPALDQTQPVVSPARP
jgi:hypothetical protein